MLYQSFQSEATVPDTGTITFDAFSFRKGAITEKAKALQQALTCSDETLEKMEEAGVSKNPATRLNSWNVKRFSRKLSNPFSFRTNATEGAPLEIPSASKKKE